MKLPNEKKMAGRITGDSTLDQTVLSELRCLNLGCGRRIHPAWENVDFLAVLPSVRSFDLRKGVPYPDESFDVVYHSHLLEHFANSRASEFLRECRRVLKPGGIIRIVVPNLEGIVRGYLEALECATQGMPGWEANYDWMLIELFDQCVREQSGGAWNAFLRQQPIPNWEFIQQRVGTEANAAVTAIRSGNLPTPIGRHWISPQFNYVLRNPGRVLRNFIARVTLGREDYEALQVGRFRRNGEIHQWMYDSYSLARLLRQVGFLDPRVMAATQSNIPKWEDYCLDSEPNGLTYKPDSLFMESTK